MTKRHTISGADEVYWGDVFYENYSPDGRRGIQWTPLHIYHLNAPDTLDADGLVKAATSTELPDTETVTYTFATDGGSSPLDGAVTDGVLDVPRNITTTTTHGSSVVAMTVLVTGTDVYGETMSELITIAAGSTSQADAGAKAFKTVTSIAITAAADAEANTLNVGWGDVFGMPVVMADKRHVISATMDGDPETGNTIVAADTTDPATTTTGDVRGTVAFGTAANGTRDFTVALQYDPTSKTSAFGVTQA